MAKVLSTPFGSGIAVTVDADPTVTPHVGIPRGSVVVFDDGIGTPECFFKTDDADTGPNNTVELVTITGDGEVALAGFLNVGAPFVPADAPGEASFGAQVIVDGNVTILLAPTAATAAGASHTVNPASATPNADLLWLGVGGVAVLHVDEDGHVGIGAVADRPLRVNRTGAGSVFRIERDTGTNGFWELAFPSGQATYNHKLTDVIWQAGGIQIWKFDLSQGAMIVGTAASTTVTGIAVEGTSVFDSPMTVQAGTAAGGVMFRCERDGGGNGFMEVSFPSAQTSINHSAGDIKWLQGGTQRMRYDASQTAYIIGPGATTLATGLDVTGTTILSSDLQIGGALNHDGTKIGFYATAPIVKQTGVAATVDALHGALVNLGLIAA